MKKLYAFTMAEILLSLTIIGVVAAITLPSLTGNINERTWNTQRKALYARFSQALALMPSLNGYGTLTAAVEADEENGVEAKDAVDTAAETFVTEGLSKVMKLNNICDNEHLQDCGIPSSFTNIGGSNKDMPTTLYELSSWFQSASAEEISKQYSALDTKAAAFETQNGECIAVYYNPSCVSKLNEQSGHYAQTKMCANFIYDLNGKKGPNTVGKDIGFITALYPTDSTIVAPIPLSKDAAVRVGHSEAAPSCTKQDSESRLPNIEELSAIFFNQTLTGVTSGGYWSSTRMSADEAWYINFNRGYSSPSKIIHSGDVRCIKRF